MQVRQRNHDGTFKETASFETPVEKNQYHKQKLWIVVPIVSVKIEDGIMLMRPSSMIGKNSN